MKKIIKPFEAEYRKLGFFSHYATGIGRISEDYRLADVPYHLYDAFHLFEKPEKEWKKDDHEKSRAILQMLQNQLEQNECTVAFHSIYRPKRVFRHDKGMDRYGPEKGWLVLIKHPETNARSQ
jgi:hypothetical protein